MSKDQQKEMLYPRIVSTAPCKDDWFEGQSHRRIANKIADVILDDNQKGIIGIDGGWGSGKSNLVALTEDAIDKRIAEEDKGKSKDEKRKYVFVTFDAWAHHTDYLRRSLLEEFIKSLIDKEVLDKSWLEKIDMLLAKVREIDTKKVVKLNEMVIATALLSAAMPIIHTISDHWERGYYLAIAAYIGVWGWFIKSRLSSLKKNNQGLKDFFSECIKLYVDKSNIESRPGYNEVNNKVSENKTVEFITEKEPTARQFRDWMHAIDEVLASKSTHVVFVIDNMDRLPIAKVKETWATIHAFFAECKYNNIQMVIPFDRSHIINAFKEENIAKQQSGEETTNDQNDNTRGEVKSYGNDFINKTFYVVYRVSPPILSDWRDYFERIWKEAFGDEIYKDHDEVMLVFEKLSPDFTPRSIIAFVNECATLCSVLEERVPAEYLGIYILGRESINEDPLKQLVKPDFLKGLEVKYDKDDNLANYLSAIHYQIKTDKALDVVYSTKVEKAVDDGDVNLIEQMGNDRVLNSLLPNAIAKVKNVDKAIDFMQAVSKREKAVDNYRLDFLWDSLFERIKDTGYTILNYDVHHAMLLEHCTNKAEVVKYFMENYLEMAKDWNVGDYVEGVKKFRKLAENETNDYIAGHHVIAKDEIIEELLWTEKDKYTDYGLLMDFDSFDSYLARKETADFDKEDYLPLIISDQCKLEETWKRLFELAEASSSVDDHTIILRRLKEINKEERLRDDYQDVYVDSKIHSLFIDMSEEDEIYSDILAMRIARAAEFNPGVTGALSAYQEVLNKDDEGLASRIADVLLLYVDYGSFMISLKDFKEKTLVSVIARILTNSETRIEKKIVSKAVMLANYKAILDVTGIEPKALLSQVQDCGGSLSFKSIQKWPMELFTDCIGLDITIAKEINNAADEYLRNVSTEQWQQQLRQAGFDLSLWTIFKPKSMNLKDAAINLLTEYATTGAQKPDKQRLMNVLNEFKEEMYNLKENFKEIYDIVIKKVNKDYIVFFTSWFFELGVIDSEGGVAGLYKTNLLDDPNVIAELVKVGNFLNKISLPSDFVEKLAQMATGNRKAIGDFVSMCENNEQIHAAMERLLHPEEKKDNKES